MSDAPERIWVDDYDAVRHHPTEDWTEYVRADLAAPKPRAREDLAERLRAILNLAEETGDWRLSADDANTILRAAARLSEREDGTREVIKGTVGKECEGWSP